MMFGIGTKKHIAVTVFKRGGEASVSSYIEGDFTKKEVLEKISEWWDNYGTGLEDYDGMQIVFKKGIEE